MVLQLGSLQGWARLFTPNAGLDPRFAESLRYAIMHGVKALAYGLVPTVGWEIMPMNQLD